MTVSNETVAGDPVVQGELDGATYWIWTREGYWNVVTAADPTAGKAFVEAYISTEHATAA